MKRLIFNHIAKTGGTSVSSWLKEIYNPIYTQEAPLGLDVYLAMKPYEREEVELLLGHRCHEAVLLCPPQTVRATVIRHPVVRAISFYYYQKNRVKHLPDLVEFVKTTAASMTPLVDMGGASEIQAHYDVIGNITDIRGFCDRLAAEIGYKKYPFDGRRLNVTEKKPVRVSPMVADKVGEYLAEEVDCYRELLPLSLERPEIPKTI